MFLSLRLYLSSVLLLFVSLLSAGLNIERFSLVLVGFCWWFPCVLCKFVFSVYLDSVLHLYDPCNNFWTFSPVDFQLDLHLVLKNPGVFLSLLVSQL